jgi:hypothetical protein
MSRVPWHLFEERQPRAHLVAGSIEVAADGNELAAALNLLKRLVRQQKPAADYTATMARDAGRPEIYFAFDDEADAREFAALLNAGPAGGHPGWASQRTFELDGAKLAKIEASLPAPTHGKENRMDHEECAGCDARPTVVMNNRAPCCHARYVVEIRDAARASLLLTSVDWIANERDLAMSAVLRLLGSPPSA